MLSEEQKMAQDAFIFERKVLPYTVFYTCSERFYIQVGLKMQTKTQAIVTVQSIWRPGRESDQTTTRLYETAKQYSKPFSDVIKAVNFIISIWEEENTHPKIYLLRLKAVHEGMLRFLLRLNENKEDAVIKRIKHIITTLDIALKIPPSIG